MKKLITLLLVSFILSACMSGAKLTERKAARLQFRQDKKCAKALKAYQAKAFKIGCGWMGPDSIIITQTQTIIRDTTITVYIKGETVHDSVLVKVKNGIINSAVSRLSTKYALSRAWVVNGMLRHTLEQPASGISATIPGAIRTTTAIKTKTIRMPAPAVKQIKVPLSWFQKLFIWSGAIAWGLVISYVLYRFRKMILFRKWLG